MSGEDRSELEALERVRSQAISDAADAVQTALMDISREMSVNWNPVMTSEDVANALYNVANRLQSVIDATLG